MKKQITPSAIVILLFILLGTLSQVQAKCPAVFINDFSVSAKLVCPGGKVSFDISTDYENTVVWNFGNGSVSTNRNPYTTYTTPGKYYIKCLVSSSCGNDSLIRDSIVVSANIPYFTLSANASNVDSICPNAKVTFNVNGGDYKTINWSFDNGHTATKSAVDEKFTTLGDHPYTLVLTDFCNNDTTLHGKTVVRHTSDFKEVLRINAPDSVCSKAKMTYNFNKEMQEIRWTFGDGDSFVGNQQMVTHFYKTDGKYTVSLTATDFCGNQLTVTDTVIVMNSIKPRFDGFSKMTDTVCPGGNFYIMTSAVHANEFNWDMGDGTYLQGDIISHEYSSVGMHYFSLKISNTCGQEITVIDSIYVSSNHKTDLTSYEYMTFSDEACLGDNFTILSFPFSNSTFILGNGHIVNERPDSLVDFTETSNLNIGLTSFHFNTYGTYKISVTNNSGCGVTDTVEVGSVEVVSSAAAMAYIGLDFLGESKGNIVYLNRSTDFYVGLGSSYDIDYGDGTTKSITTGGFIIDKHTYTAEGTYNVSLKVTNSCGESDSTVIVIKVIKDPNGYASVIENSAETMRVEAFPNPTKDVVTFKFDRGINEHVMFSIYDVQGQLIHEQNIVNSNTIDFDFSQFSSGLYLAGFVSETQNTRTRVMLIK